MTLRSDEVYKINKFLVEWVEDVSRITKPKEVVWCDGSVGEYDSIVKQMLFDKTLVKLDQRKYSNCYLHRSDPNDTARTEDRTFICTKERDDSGPTNNWIGAEEAKRTLWQLLDGGMRGRTMFVVPYLLGPVKSPYSQPGVQITDSPYVVISLRTITMMGITALSRLGSSARFVKGIHCQGTLDNNNKYICHFPEEQLIVSVNSNYGGNALLSKKCHALRMASVMARDEGWLAEHTLIVGVEDPDGNVTYLMSAFPSGSGKTNLAMLRPSAPFTNWKVWMASDDIAWVHLDSDGIFQAVNPEYGLFCIAPGTSVKSNPNAIQTMNRNTIFTNVALTSEGTPWWEGMTDIPPSNLIDWRGRPWKGGSNEKAAHPNSRYTTPLSQYPYLSERWQDPQGVPISGILFGGRRATTIPLVYESLSWEHGVLMGAMLRVETTAAATGRVGVVRGDPMAMKPFCGYNMADYFNHWLSFSSKSKNLPKIFQVNWFRKGEDGRFLWPGYSENLRVIKWIIERIKGVSDAVETPIGYVPTPDSLDLTGLQLAEGTLEKLLYIDKSQCVEEVQASKELFESFGDRFPERLWREYWNLMDRLKG